MYPPHLLSSREIRQEERRLFHNAKVYTVLMEINKEMPNGDTGSDHEWREDGDKGIDEHIVHIEDHSEPNQQSVTPSSKDSHEQGAVHPVRVDVQYRSVSSLSRGSTGSFRAPSHQSVPRERIIIPYAHTESRLEKARRSLREGRGRIQEDTDGLDESEQTRDVRRLVQGMMINTTPIHPSDINVRDVVLIDTEDMDTDREGTVDRVDRPIVQPVPIQPKTASVSSVQSRSVSQSPSRGSILSRSSKDRQPMKSNRASHSELILLPGRDYRDRIRGLPLGPGKDRKSICGNTGDRGDNGRGEESIPGSPPPEPTQEPTPEHIPMPVPPVPSTLPSVHRHCNNCGRSSSPSNQSTPLEHQEVEYTGDRWVFSDRKGERGRAHSPVYHSLTQPRSVHSPSPAQLTRPNPIVSPFLPPASSPLSTYQASYCHPLYSSNRYR